MIPRPAAFTWRIVRTRYLGIEGISATVLALIALLEVSVPIYLSRVTNALAQRGGPALADAWTWIAVIALLWLATDVLGRIYDALNEHLFAGLKKTAEIALYSEVIHQDGLYFTARPPGKLGQKIRVGGGAAANIAVIVLRDFFKTGVFVLAGAVVLSSQSVLFGAIFAIFSTIYLVGAALFARRCIPRSRAMADASSQATSVLMDTMANWEAVRSHAKERAEIANFSGALQVELERTLDHRRYIIYLKTFQNAITLVLLGSTLALSLLLLQRGTLSIGGFVMVFAFGGLVGSHLRNLSFQMLNFFEHVGILDDALREIDGCGEAADPVAVPLALSGGAVEFRDVTFAYPGSPPILRELSFSVRPGEKVLIVGASGAGKSTIFRLLKRIFRPQHGQILLDGHDVADIPGELLAPAIGDAPQLVGIFQRTIRENVEYARMPDHAGQGELERAMTLAGASDFVAAKPAGFDTMAGTQGGALSGGERQRVALARMLLKHAPLLLLDEATSALDAKMEASILNALLRALPGTTMIFISHRMTLSPLMDRILVVEEGRIAEAGTHAELLARGGTYAKIWRAREAFQ